MNEPQQLIDQSQWDSGWAKNVHFQQWTPIDANPGRAQRLWLDYLLETVPSGARVLEIGCGGSQILPFLARCKQAEVWGIDYSPTGLELAQKGMEAEGVQGRFILGDALAENDAPRGYFDVVLTMGVIEHFPPPGNIDTTVRFSEYARSGGLIITFIPNMAGIIGLLTRWLDRPLYNQHVPLDAQELDALHKAASLQIVRAAEYVGGFEFGVINHTRLVERYGAQRTALIWKLGYKAQGLYLRLFPKRESRWFSPYVIGTYRK
jgi:2-polyprenyl-3-methyl-5-hydroxy-6-metoxy-1,4-benzoquinol methylase